MEDKTKAIVAHITFIGWIVALIVNLSEKKTELASYYLRQLLGLHILSMVAASIPRIGWIIGVIVFIFWLISLIGAIKGEKSESPWIGQYFQKWFDFL
ncbi:MAG: hypothetical protein ACWA5K_08710 [bacterium]